MIPKIVIVGRPNVGKSSLLNLLARKRIAIVDPTAGVTRDRVGVTVELPSDAKGVPDYTAEVYDTGGYGISDIEIGDHGMTRDMTADVQRQIEVGLREADLVLFVIDAQAGVTGLDQQFAEVLRKTAGQKPVLLIANKVDSERHEAGGYEAAALGFGDPVLVSAETGYQKYTLYEAIRNALNFEEIAARRAHFSGHEEERDVPLIAIVGKRNAGKSTLVNALAGDERVIVSEQPGTTRDSVDVNVEIDGKKMTLIDTAGVRKTKSLAGDIEYYSQHRALRSVRRADVCLLLIDAAVPVSQVDKQLVGEILTHFRPTVVVVNKWDIAEKDYTQEEYVEYLDDALKGLSFAPIVFISALKAEGMREVMGMALNLYDQARHRVGTGELNAVVEKIFQERGPSSKGGKQAKVYYATQVDINPPTIALFVNHPELFEGGYERYLLNRFRDELAYSEVPIKLLFRGKQSIPVEERLARKRGE